MSRRGAYAMSKEVSGEDEGVTLSECIADGRVPVPERMSFPKWQSWRRGEGRRPVLRRDGRGISTKDEVALWKATMVELYGAEDSDEDEEGSLELEPDESSALAVRPDAAVGGLKVGGGAGGTSPRPSSAGTGAAGTDELLKLMKQVFRPDQEEMGVFLSRITRLVMALKTLGHEVTTGDLALITLKA